MTEAEALAPKAPWTFREADLRLEALRLAVATGVDPAGVVELAKRLHEWLQGRDQGKEKPAEAG